MPVNCTAQLTLGTLDIRVDAKRKVSFRGIQQQYGDGYMSRRQDGINPVMEQWDITTPVMDIEQAYVLENEIITLGTGSFAWIPPNETEEKNWVLDPIEWEMNYATTDTASLSFRIKRFYT